MDMNEFSESVHEEAANWFVAEMGRRAASIRTKHPRKYSDARIQAAAYKLAKEAFEVKYDVTIEEMFA
jgi:hypothetical protein